LPGKSQKKPFFRIEGKILSFPGLKADEQDEKLYIPFFKALLGSSFSTFLILVMSGVFG
jgi:hypothetical protein